MSSDKTRRDKGNVVALVVAEVTVAGVVIEINTATVVTVTKYWQQ